MGEFKKYLVNHFYPTGVKYKIQITYLYTVFTLGLHSAMQINL